MPPLRRAPTPTSCWSSAPTRCVRTAMTKPSARARLYLDAGADMIKMFPRNAEEAKRVPQDLPGVPLVYVTSPGNRRGWAVLTAPEAEAYGYKLIYDSIATTTATAMALKHYFESVVKTAATASRRTRRRSATTSKRRWVSTSFTRSKRKSRSAFLPSRARSTPTRKPTQLAKHGAPPLHAERMGGASARPFLCGINGG